MAESTQLLAERLIPVGMAELKTHNHLLGDHEALGSAWEEDGYWFFRDVLDRSSVSRLRSVYIDVLEKEGVVDSVDRSDERGVVYNGRSLENFPFRMEPLAASQPWRAFVAEKPVDDFFRLLFGCDPLWVPIVEYRATPPSKDRPSGGGSSDDGPERFVAIHQDGPFSPGIPFRICWFPLAEINAETGGLALAEGMTERVNRHPLIGGSNQLIPFDDIPRDRWRRATYRPGDVLLMNPWVPHSGLTNVSDRFRLSLDHRVMASTENCPVVGTVVSITPAVVVVRDTQREWSLLIDAETYVRDHMGRKLQGDAITAYFKSGGEIIVAHEEDRATVVRPSH